ncbi:TPA: hypothetical protein ACSPZX_002419 [Aeromonas veronii]|nr:hypothetical protein [Aeromonas veronii]
MSGLFQFGGPGVSDLNPQVYDLIQFCHLVLGGGGTGGGTYRKTTSP